jgi:hypothetical protein
MATEVMIEVAVWPVCRSSSITVKLDFEITSAVKVFVRAILYITPDAEGMSMNGWLSRPRQHESVAKNGVPQLVFAVLYR